jgi:RHS repeat-associated protein
MVDRAVGELAEMHARLGHGPELEALFKDIGKRPIGGPATETIQGAHEGLWSFKVNPGESYLCGPRALENLLITLKASPKQIQIADDARSCKHGVSLAQLATLADKTKLKYTLVHREPGQPVPTPSIIHWNLHHYAAVIGTQDGRYILQDPTFGDGAHVVTPKGIDAESSGYFLVPASVMAANPKAGWRVVSRNSAEITPIYGMGNPSGNLPLDTNCCSATSTPNSTPVPKQVPKLVMDTDAAPPNRGMTAATIHTMVVSLHLSDTSIGYAPQKGVPAFVTLTYNQREAGQPATFSYSNMSPKWSHNWMAYIQDDPANVGQSVTRVMGEGGGFLNPTGYSTTTGAFVAEPFDNSTLYRLPATGTATSYELRTTDGGKQVYSLFDGATTFPRRAFLTSVVDPAGNTTTISYDTSLRITSLTDAMSRSTTFTYGLSGSPLLVTQITDPFGRSTQLAYDTSGRLSSITDAVGITSSFTYSTTEPSFVTQLTTPYGNSVFSDTVDPNDFVITNTRSLTITDPLGYSEYAYFYPNYNIVPASETPIPSPGMNLYDGLMQWRNTFYWDKHAFAQGVTMTSVVVTAHDYTKSTILHWVHDVNVTSLAGMVLESEKKPLERRTWFDYPLHAGVNLSIYSGTLNRRTASGRVLDDGTIQISNATYNTAGKALTQADPKGRAAKYTYATNNIDLLTVQQLTAPSTYTTIATYGSYTTTHLPQTYTDAAGKVWNFTWTTAGQIATVTDPNSGVTTWNYDGSGRLSNIVNANSQTQVSYTYDSADRIRTKTDSEGYVLTYDYDNLDRVTKITYPDGTTDLNDYTFQSGTYAGTASLELRKHTDRLGRVTTYGYDADQRMTSVTEPTSGTGTRTTNYAYYENGTLKSITDANSNVTSWDIDIESRPTVKHYADASTETYTYETTTSRVKSIKDALNQTKTFAYGLDDRMTGITYTGAVNTTPNVTFAWDTYFPRLSSMADGLGTTNYAYTAIGTNGALKLSSIDGPYSNDAIGLTYDALGRMSGRNITGGNETFGYDAINRLTSHGTPLGSFTDTWLGQTNQQASQGVTNGSVTASTNWGYDTNTNDRRLTSITNSGVSRSYTFGYTSGSIINPYDIMSITDTAATGHPWATQSRGYTYDLIDRLLTASSTTPGNNTYVYDPLDNATTITNPGTGTVNPTYNNLNQLHTWGANTYAYDANGNTTSGDGTRTYKYDAENRLVEIDYVGSTAKSQFAYDGMGRRTVDVETASGGGTTTTRYLWCGSSICQTRNGSDTVLRRDLAEGELNVSTSQKLVYMTDQIGSARDVLDATTGNLVQSYDYTPYGAVARSNGSTPTDYQYAGLMYHSASGLLMSATRFFDPVTGRWINRDPIREDAGPNLYAYTDANPIMWTDEEGLCGDPKICEKLQQKIENTRNELAKRSYDLKVDKLNLRITAPTGPRMTVESHEKEFESRQEDLRDYLDEYNKNGCGPGFPIPVDARTYSTMPTPVYGQSTMDQGPNFPAFPAPSPTQWTSTMIMISIPIIIGRWLTE